MDTVGFIIDGKTVKTELTAPVINPATAEAFAVCPQSTKDHLDQAVTAARRAFRTWSQTSLEERSAAVLRIADAIEANKSEIAHLTMLENGKPLTAALGEVGGGALAWIRASANLRPPVELVQDDDNARVEVHHKPLGVVGSITPWNHPILIACWHIMPALMAGDTVIIKPSGLTPFGTLKLVEVINSQLPPGVVNSVIGENGIGQAMTAHPGIDKIVFTGSTPTGRHIMGNAASTLKRLTLELGGNDAAIVLEDVDLEKSIDNIFKRAFGNSGQTCAALKRLYVHESIHDIVVDQLSELANNAVLGAGDQNGVQFGPVQNEKQFNFVKELARDTIENGGTFVTGGVPVDRPGYFFPLSIATNVSNGMRIVDEEQFGPLLPVIKYRDVDDAIAMANDSENGLGGSIWTRDEKKGVELAKRLECGTAWVNNHSQISPIAPFGGAKQSGIGVEFGWWGMADFMQLQTVNLNKKGGLA
ncbi:MAG: aldehyde dehydrogenase family protein [Henriciella sp.]